MDTPTLQSTPQPAPPPFEEAGASAAAAAQGTGQPVRQISGSGPDDAAASGQECAATGEDDEDLRGLSREEAIAKDREMLDDVIHAHHIKSWAGDFCILVSHCTAYRRLTAHLTFTEGYPEEVVHIELQSELLPPKLLAKLRDMAEAHIVERGLRGKPHVASVYAFLDDTIHENRLLYATPEVRKCIALSQEEPAFHLAVNDKAGTLVIKAKSGKYSLKAAVTVPIEYPAEALQVEVVSCSFPYAVWITYVLQAREIARKCQLGVPTELAVAQSTTLVGLPEVPPAPVKASAPAMDAASLLDIKDDVKFLKQATDLRSVDASFNKQLQKFEHSTRVRRAARRELRKRTQAQLEKDLEVERKAAQDAEQAQMKEWRRIMGMSDKGPQRSLFAVVRFLVRGFFFRLPNEISAVSGARVFPDDPAELSRVLDKRKSTRPIRVPTCGCWFIYKELDEFLTVPPFGKPCPRPECKGIVVQHPDWPHDVKKLEKAWAMKMAREREIAEVSDLFGLDDSFKA